MDVWFRESVRPTSNVKHILVGGCVMSDVLSLLLFAFLLDLKGFSYVERTRT